MKLASVPFRTLLRREVERFMSVPTQTVFTPLISALLYLLIFGVSLGNRISFHDLPYTAFLIPGLVMMGVLNHSFQNTASSIMISKFEGNIVEILVAPISYLEMTFAYTLGGVVRGSIVGLATWLVSLPFQLALPRRPFFALAMALLASATFSLLGILAAIWADRFDGISAVSTFVILPLTYLGGVFYSQEILPPFWRSIAHFNPMLYMVDGLRFGFFGVSDVNPALSLTVTGLLATTLFTAVVLAFRTGWRLRS
jgi:ABC-2 type transport system permease protein